MSGLGAHFTHCFYGAFRMLLIDWRQNGRVAVTASLPHDDIALLGGLGISAIIMRVLAALLSMGYGWT